MTNHIKNTSHRRWEHKAEVAESLIGREQVKEARVVVREGFKHGRDKLGKDIKAVFSELVSRSGSLWEAGGMARLQRVSQGLEGCEEAAAHALAEVLGLHTGRDQFTESLATLHSCKAVAAAR